MNEEFQDRINQAINIDWSKVTPDMYCTPEEWHQEMLDYIEQNIVVKLQWCDRCSKPFSENEIYCIHCHSCQICLCCPCGKLECEWCGDCHQCGEKLTDLVKINKSAFNFCSSDCAFRYLENRNKPL